MSSAVAVVVIGRNEGARLEACLASLTGLCETIVYVDSGSSDGSPNVARESGVELVELERNRPFTAARGRNAGFERVRELAHYVEFVQFVDGDCQVDPEWIETAVRHLEQNSTVAAVAGRRRERFPNASVYNRLADIEWDTPIGEDGGFGGDVMVRAQVFADVSGYDESLIAGEDPDLCLRIRAKGHGVMRLDAEMTTHDADMHHFSEFWRRQIRGGHAYAERLARRGRRDGDATLRQVVSILVYGLALPVGALVLIATGSLLGWVALLAYPVLWWRIFDSQRSRQSDGAAAYATFGVIGKSAEACGVLLFGWNRYVLGKRSELIEYKGAA